MIYSMFHEDSQSAQITNTHNLKWRQCYKKRSRSWKKPFQSERTPWNSFSPPPNRWLSFRI